jgi:SpoU rRNA methylase family enzyme
MVSEQVLVITELASFLASLSPKKVLAFHPSPKVQERVTFLLEKNKTNDLTPEENREMEKYMIVEQLVQLVKAQALIQLVKK